MDVYHFSNYFHKLDGEWFFKKYTVKLDHVRKHNDKKIMFL